MNIRIKFVFITVFAVMSSCKRTIVKTEIMESISKTAVIRYFFKSSDDFIEKYSKSNINKDVLISLKNDIDARPALKALLEQDDNIVRAYSKVAHLPKSIRSNTEILKWVNGFQELPNTFKQDVIKLSFLSDELGQKLIVKDGNTICGEFAHGVFSIDAGVSAGVKNRVPSNVLLNINLVPNSLYKVDNRFVYKVDELGRVANLSMLKPLKLVDRGRNIRSQSYVNFSRGGVLREGSRSSDVAGHIIAQRFDGPSELINFFPQLPTQNSGQWKALENEFARLISEGKKVRVSYVLRYVDNTLRPSSIEAKYTINDGAEIAKWFRN